MGVVKCHVRSAGPEPERQQRIALHCLTMNGGSPSPEWRPRTLFASLPLLLTLLGLLLAIGQFLYNRSLWLDEALLALNILDRSIPELMTPLNNDQVAPLLFLVFEKVFSTLLPATEHGLRILPLLCYAVGSFAFLGIVRSLFKDTPTRIFAVSLFVLNGNLIYYASEVKQYIGDVAVANVIILLVLRYTSTGRGLHLLGAFALIATWFSSVTPIVVVTAFVHLLACRYRKGELRWSSSKVLLAWAVLWVLAFLVYYVIAVHDHPAQESMRRFWLSAQGLVPNDPFSALFYHAVYDRVVMVFTQLLPFGSINAYALLVLVIIGCITSLHDDRRTILVLSGTPILLHLLLAVLHLYPFETRLILYLIPAVILIAAQGFQKCMELLPGDRNAIRQWGVAVCLPLLLAVTFVRSGYPMDRQEIRSCLEFIVKNAMTNDRILVDPGAGPACTYYERINDYDGLPIIHIGQSHTAPYAHLSDSGDPRGGIWFVFNDLHPTENNMLLAQLNSKGYRCTAQHHASGAHAYRYLIP